MGPYVTLRERHERKLNAYQQAVAALKPILADYGRAHGGRFVLFGSAARGTPHDESDVDILVDFLGKAANRACAFAEERCWALGVRPDVRPLDWTSDDVAMRALQEGVVLGAAP